ncbi:class I SAM-dependent methyltransferase [Kiloniella majae]|uniref:class I SAM-dependent methyltransferase n=1 Tax=Kiloniella majae TaxID=1938558 RepID=UPI0015C4FA9A|nr:class I SAM-dependent methyltransferase [Kiloniella majae]
MTLSTELIFPGGLPDSKAYKLEAETLNKRIIGASCTPNDPAEKLYNEWQHIPSIHSNNFEDAFVKTILEHNVSQIYCPHLLLYKAIEKIILSNDLSVRFRNPPPGELETKKINTLYKSAIYFHKIASNMAISHQERLPKTEEIAGLIFYTRAIPGMTSEEKLAALASIFPVLPKGDIIEIGAYRGKSSYFLSWAARRYNIGKVLVVDPWDAIVAQQNDSPDVLKDPNQELVEDVSSFWESAHQGFLAALSPFIGHINYLRKPSQDAARIYSSNNEIQSSTFGTTKYCGKISLIHIDGNHDYNMVKKDCDSWLKFMTPGGWIIFDDYIWLHGDGPTRAGDEYLRDNKDNIELSFCFEKSLFIQLKQRKR